MYHVALPSVIASGDNKGKPATVDITAAKLTRKDESGKDVPVKYEIPAEKFEYPQFGPKPAVDEKGNDIPLSDDQAREGVEEAIKDAGGVVRFLENYNDATRTAALNKGKNYIRTKESGNPSDIEAAGIELTKNFTWAQAERKTNKEVREGVEALAADVDNLSKEELAKRLKALIGAK